MTTRGPSSDFENPKGEDTHTALPSGRDVFGNRIIYRPNQGDNGNVGPSPTSREQFEQEPFRPSKPRELNVRDVFAFTVNNMVGTGIYTTPPVVLYLTNSKYVALALWIVGFLYTAIRYFSKFVVALDETLPRPRLLSYTIYSFYAILIYNDATNSMQFAKQTLTFLSDNPADPSLNPWFLRFMAFVVLSFVCLLHYFSSRAGQDLSQILACAKITLLVVLIFGGIPRAVNHFTRLDNATVLLAVPHNALHNPLDDTYATYAPLVGSRTLRNLATDVDTPIIVFREY
ncbi:hypothetical protein HYALB_00008749 [Hymenoscyphus albidus]|uniref:Uncharacterized protein n=1 Tax=Hymenoscyphus albidus TaxID=595503 RepID=A0A9N9Q389_9HELO|nr:hypothetical protein HYALB_00008749 [Hymenoscyphus albidus]